MSMSEQLQRAMFNGRTLDGKFRRGWWKVADAKATDGCPDIIKEQPDDAKIFWYNGCLMLVAGRTKDGRPYITKNGNYDGCQVLRELTDVLIIQNGDGTLVGCDDFGKATRQGAKRDLEALLSI